MTDDTQPPTKVQFGGLNPEGLFSHAMRSPRTGTWTPPTVEQLQRVLPQYHILSIAGRGGMGAVYKAWQKSLDRHVAIKVLPAELENDEAGFAARFKREAKAMALLNHPNIVAIHDAGEVGTDVPIGPRTAEDSHPYHLLYFVMDFVEGTDVQRLVAERGHLPEHEALPIAAAVLDALAYAHGKGVIHRDIKPSNVMLDPEGHVKVADFGLAKIATAASSTQLTASDVMMGTPAFMAPEALTGTARVDARADLYAVGVMLYQMLTGALPHGVFDPPSTRVKCDRRLDEIVHRALQADPTRRYQSGAEMKTALGTVRVPRERRLAVAGGDDGPPQTATANRRSLLLLAALVVIALAWGGVAFMLRPSGKPQGDTRISAAVGQAPRLPVGKATPPASGALALQSTPTTATKDAPFVNSLGMKFVPVPITGGPTGGQRVLFSVWETRKQDYEAFAKETQRKTFFPGWLNQPTQPVNVVSWNDAKAFCAWLTERERKTGHIGSGDEYRLPLDHEWSCAVGIGDKEDPNKPPAEKGNKLPGIYPWGTAWPPPPGSGNFADETLKADPSPDIGLAAVLDGYNDGFTFPAPVGSFVPNALGLYDLAGNMGETCEDMDRPGSGRYVVRGSAWRAAGDDFRSERRAANPPDHGSFLVGFRPVLAVGTAVQAKGDDRAAAEWVLGLGGRLTLKAGGRTLKLTSAAELPQGAFTIVEVRLENLKKQPASLAPLSGLAELSTLALVGSGIRDELLPSLGSPPKLRDIFIDHTSITDEATGSICKLRAIETLTLSANNKFTGRRLGELALPRLSRLCLQRSAISDEALKQIAVLRSINYLDLTYTPITDAGMAGLAPLHQLTDLLIASTGITSSGLTALGPAVPLQSLSWTFPREAGPVQFEKVAAVFPKLSSFSLETSHYAPEDIAFLAALSGLRELRLLRGGATDDMLKALLELPQITSLHLRDCQQFTGPGLAHLLGHPALVSVKLEDLNQITDADVLQLTAMKRLTSLGVLNCKKITPEGIEAFRRARPDVKIER